MLRSRRPTQFLNFTLAHGYRIRRVFIRHYALLLPLILRLYDSGMEHLVYCGIQPLDSLRLNQLSLLSLI